MHSLARIILSSVLLVSSLSWGMSASAGPDVDKLRWQIKAENNIAWEVSSGAAAHKDTIEMSGLKISPIITYGVDDQGKPVLQRLIVWPLLRRSNPSWNKTHDHWQESYGADVSPEIEVNGNKNTIETVTRFQHKSGTLIIESRLGEKQEISLTRTIFPSVDKPAYIEEYTLTNRASTPLTVEVKNSRKSKKSPPEKGVYGSYVFTALSMGTEKKSLRPGETVAGALVIMAQPEKEMTLVIDPVAERQARLERVKQWQEHARLVTPVPALNTMYAFAKIRATESIFTTAAGLLHSPGGNSFYAAIWANDQAEYANPFFGFLGDKTATEASINSYRIFACWMNPEYKPIPSSIIDEGRGFWNGAGDRGDMAMIAYGAARFALANGDKKAAEELWPLIEWCLEYSRRKTDANGVIASDSDELEGRFPAGKANLCTSSLHYDALRSAVFLGRDLGKPEAQLKAYAAQADALHSAIEKHFGATVEGFPTYRYFDKNDLAGNKRYEAYADKDDILRAWICIPLTCGILDRAEGTINALFSPRLWTANGLATTEGDKTFWDRSTLYALRGVFAAGATRQGLDFLTYYSNRRLLGEHVPYPVEAWPEGNQRHLSAESALYCRIFTEGLFGIRPTGLHSFDCTPRLPEGWPEMKLQQISAFGQIFDLSVSRVNNKLKVEASRPNARPRSQVIQPGETVSIIFE